MTVLAQDNFDTDTVGSIAPGWVAKIGAWAVGTVNPVSGANTFGSTSATDGDTVLYTALAARADMQIETSQKLVAGSGNSLPLISHVLRSDSGNSNHYAIIFSSPTTTGVNVTIYKRINGTYSQVNNTVLTWTLAVGDVMHLKSVIIGSTITIFKAINSAAYGAAVATATDTNVTAAGYPGLYYSKPAGAPLMAIDDFAYSDGAAATLPGAPTIGTLTAGVGVMSITFTPGASGTNPTTSYIATASTGETATGTASPIAFSGLSAGARTVHVQGVSSDGTGPASAESNSATVTASGDVTPPTLTGSVTLGTPGQTSIPISYPAGSDNVGVAGYEVSINGGTSYTSVGNTTSPTLTGLTPNTAYPAPRVRAFDAAGNRSTPPIVSSSGFTTAASTGFTNNIAFSPGNWNVQSAFAQSINPGAWLEFIATGASATLNFDVSGLVAPYPQLTYQVDRHGPIVSVPVAATVVMTPASDTSDYANKGGHFYEVLFKSASETVQRWSPQQAALRLTGITVDSGASVSKPQADVRGSIIGFSDSIFECVRTVNSTATSDTDRNDASQGFMLELSRQLGLRYGNVGFGATGYTVTGSGGVPALPSSIGFIYSGAPRTFPSDMVAAVIGAGINDGSTNVQSAAVTVLNYLLTNMPASAVVFVMRPLNGGHEAQLQAAIAACMTPARCFYVDTTGIFRTADSSDNLHPYGPENIRIARMVAALVKPNLPGSSSVGPTLNPRTVVCQLASGANTDGSVILAANLSGLKVWFFDSPTPDATTVPRYATSSAATDSNGNLTFVAQSALASGGTGYIVVQSSNGLHYNGPVTVA